VTTTKLGRRHAAPPAVLQALLESRRQFIAFLARRLGSEPVAEEVLHSAYLKALESAPDAADEEGVVRWFYRVLRNAVADRHRRGDAEQRALRAHAADAPSTWEPEWERTVCRCIHAVLPTLKDEYAAIVRQVDLEGRSLADVARTERLTTNNASVRLHRARRALKKNLEQTCGACAQHGCLDCSCGGAGGLGYTAR
jgi:RNA polymerase sigma-70 factor (ECF subfamily)